MNRHFHTMFMKPCKHACFLLLMLFLSSCGQVPPPATETSTIPPFAWTAVALTQTALSIPVVMFTPTLQVTPIPTLPPPPILTPDAIQVERWQEYQRELIKALLFQYPPELHDLGLCEWDILGRSKQKLYVWVLCGLPGGGGADIPAVIHINTDGSIQNVEVPSRGSTWEANLNKLFPADVREKLDLYYFIFCAYCGRPEELRIHLLYRQTHPGEPPLVVQSFVPTVLPTP